MRIFYVRKVFLFCLVALLIYLVGFASGRFGSDSWPAMGLLAKEMPLFSVKKAASEVCLTFDISWGEKTLPLVLQILKENQVPATFFLSGPWALKHSEQVKAICADGHEVASHGDRHINLSQYPRDVVRENISRAQQDLLTLVDRVAPYFRPPNGDYDDVVIDTARELGFETVIWAVDSLDWKNPGPRYMIERVVSKSFPGAIILCHASDSSKEIHLALPGIIQGLRSKGYQLKTLSDLCRNGELIRRDPR